MKIRKTGIDYIDKTLSRLYGGLSILIVSDSFSFNDANRLWALLGLNFLEKGGAVIAVHTNLPFYIIQKQVEKNYSNEKNMVFQKAIRDGKFYFLDLVSGEDKTNTTFNGVKSIRGIANDPDRIIYEINSAKNQIKQKFPDTPILVAYVNISSSVVDFGSKPVLKMIRRLIIDTKREGDILLGIANREVHKPTVTNTLSHLVDYVINFGLEKINDKKQSYVHVSRTPLLKEAHKLLNQKFAYYFSGDKFLTLFPLYHSFDELIKSMSFNELGQISLRGWNHVITPVQTFILAFKNMEKVHNYEEQQQILFNYGLTVGIGAALLIKTESGLSNKQLVKEVLKYNTLAGWGRTLSIEGSIDEGKIKLTGVSTIALSYGHSDHPVCTFVGGAIAGILQIATKKEWTCRETKCMAKGDEYCEFELELK